MADATAPIEAVPCECEEHACVPVPKQHVRYDIRVGPDLQGVIRLCAHCFINGHMGIKEYRWRGQRNEVKA